ncbi:hypothetical protein [Nocardia sp. AG03]|uniref:hypothetical protein n=1 Tax=Nocardia sp. AG03 TaxID=3025312 RepID=UPI002418A443|nr:hypothetical protein [Nocardia sp. AG03]
MRITHVSALAAVLVTLGTASAAAQANPADTPRQAIARSYLDALVSHDASAVPFAPDATRVEAGFQTGYSGPQLAHDLEHGLQYRVIQGIRDLTMSESGDTVSTRYLLDTGVAGVRLTTVEIVETFVIPVDSIQTIEATITPV